MPSCFSLTRRLLLCLGLTLTAGLSHSAAQAAPGDLDPSFGTGGIVTHNFSLVGGNRGVANAVTALPDGKVLIAGPSTYGASADFVVLRLTSNGALDSTFGKVGKAVIPVGTREDIPNALVVDPKGRIVVAGQYGLGHDSFFCAIRLLANGKLDTSFGNGGKVLFPASTQCRVAYGIAIDPKGRILLAGGHAIQYRAGFSVARLLENGQLDTSFHNHGYRNFQLPDRWQAARAVVIGSGGRIFLIGNGRESDEGPSGFAVIRLKEDGSLDTAFDGDGRSMVAGGTYRATANAAILDQNNRIVIAGEIDGNFSAVRINANGALDGTFGNGGKQILKLGGDALYGFSNAFGVALDTKQRIVLAGIGDKGFTIVRLLPDGTPDTSFDEDGSTSIVVSQQNSIATAVAIDSRSGVVAVGRRTTGNSNFDMAAVRLLDDGALDTAFARNGVSAQFFASRDEAIGIRRLADGKIIVAGTTTDGNKSVFALLRLNADGSVDTTFAQSGQALISVSDGDDVAYSMAVDNQNRILIAGISADGHKSQASIVRLLPDASFDISFNGTGKLLLTLPNTLQWGPTIKLDRNNKILLGCGAGDNGFALVRLNNNGSLDSSFAGDGVITSNPNLSGVIRDFAVDNKNRIVVISDPTSSINGYHVARLNPNGSLDTSFGKNGTRGVGPGEYAYPKSIAFDNQGRVVIAAVLAGFYSGGLIVRLTENGANDITFSEDGKFYFNYGRPASEVDVLKIRSDGRLVLGGWASDLVSSYGTISDFAVAVVLPNGGLDTGFGDGGVTRVALKGEPYGVVDMALYEDGRILTVGTTGAGFDYSADFALARFLGPAQVTQQSAPSGKSARFSRLFQ